MMLMFSLFMIIVGIVAVFDMRAEGDGGSGALGLLVFVAILSPFIYWGYVMLYKFLRPGQPVKFQEDGAIWRCGSRGIGHLCVVGRADEQADAQNASTHHRDCPRAQRA